ncbi:MAG: hypothetical protein KJ674_03455 [Nanoarchaeota archaeon]|nr:hypothetical protein [Nanoarchaeota archaeon]
MIGKEPTNFMKLLFLLFITLLLTFIFFYPKFEFEEEELTFLGPLSTEETKNLILDNLEEGDIILNRPQSFSSYYMQNKQQKLFKNIFFFFSYYNLFDKIFIRSMGEEGYWHIYIYKGNNTIHSLSLLGVEEGKIDNDFVENNYLKILKVNTTKENKIKAIERSNYYFESQEIYYSLKNGLIIVFAKSTGANYIFHLDKQKLVCSSYIALLYKDISFNLKKDYTYITPTDIENSDVVDTIIITKKEGVYYER